MEHDGRAYRRSTPHSPAPPGGGSSGCGARRVLRLCVRGGGSRRRDCHSAAPPSSWSAVGFSIVMEKGRQQNDTVSPTARRGRLASAGSAICRPPPPRVTIFSSGGRVGIDKWIDRHVLRPQRGDRMPRGILPAEGWCRDFPGCTWCEQPRHIWSTGATYASHHRGAPVFWCCGLSLMAISKPSIAGENLATLRDRGLDITIVGGVHPSAPAHHQLHPGRWHI